ncbi:MAG: hypothetical protein Q9216_003826 [Gyalolechia sp. 2 TL-2023]
MPATVSHFRHQSPLTLILNLLPWQPKTPKTGSTKSGQSSKSVTSNIRNVRDHFSSQNVWFEEDDHYDRQPKLKELVDGILDKPGVEFRTASVNKFRTYLHEHGTDSEDTLLETLFDMVVKTSKPALTSTGSLDDAMTETVENIFTEAGNPKDRDFTDDGLTRVRKCSFAKGFVPNQTEETRELGLKDPKPDLTWGKIIPKKQEKGKGLSVVDKEIEQMIKVCPGVQHAFAAAQFKSAQKSIEDAENQSILTGAAMVEASHRIIAASLEKLNDDDLVDASTSPNKKAATGTSTLPSSSTQADLQSIAFTVSWTPQLAKLHLHWCEERGAEHPIYHATFLNAYLFCKQKTLKENLTELRNDMMNIFEWGIYTRMNAMTEILRKVYPDY